MKKKSKTSIIVWTIVVILLLMNLKKCNENDGYSSLNDYETNSSTICTGDNVIVKEKCIGAIDEECYDEMMSYCINKDERGLEIMESQYKIKILPVGEVCKVLQTGISKIKIRLLDDEVYWVSRDKLTKNLKN